MGTTVTDNLGLIKPDSDESIKEDLPTFDGWASQNAENMDAIDALFRVEEDTYALDWIATTTNPTLGAGGSVEGKFLRIYPRMVLVYFKINCGGAGFAAGSGVYRIALPTGVASEFSLYDSELPIGKAVFLDNSAALTSSVFTLNYNRDVSLTDFTISQGGFWTDANPVVLAQNDKVSGWAMYPTDDA